MSDAIDLQIDAALQHHQAGRLTQAKAEYSAVLEQDPDCPDALHLLGVLNHQEKNYQQAIQLITRAIELDPAAVEFHTNLAEAYKSSGRGEQAIVAYQQAIALDPNFLATWQNLGVLLQIHRRPAEAVNAWQQSIQLGPGLAESYNNLGIALQTLGKLTEAVEHYRRALAIHPGLVQAIENLTIVHIMLGEKDQAIKIAKSLVEHLAGQAPAYVFLAAAMNDVGHYHDAIDTCRDALRIDPQCVNAHFNLGRAMAGLGEPRAAAIAYARAAEIDPDSAYAQIKLGLSALSTGHIDIGTKCFTRTTELAPELPEGWYNLGVAFDRLNDLDRAMQMARRAIALRPSMVEGITMLGVLHLRKGEFDEAEIELQRAIDIQPAHAPAIAALANVYAERGEHVEAQKLARQAVDAAPKDLKAFDVLLMTLIADHRSTADEIFREHLRFGEKLPAYTALVLPPDRLDPSRRLKIGYVSPDLRAHSVSFFLFGLIKEHNHEQFEIIFYDDSLKPDVITTSMKNFSDQWHRVTGISNEKLAEQIIADEIDILVDLAGHTADNRLPLFAVKPAPVQISYLGYAATTGVPAIDYRLTDELADPVGLTDAYHTEKLLRIPSPFLCYQPSPEPLPMAPLPALTNGFVTFCSFNVASKLNDAVLDLWARLLVEVEGSRLLLKASAFKDHKTCTRIETRFAKLGVQKDRLEFVQRTDSFSAHMATYNRADIALDPFPYNGTTTTCEALWMGLPVVTLTGQTHSGRVGVSLLSSIGLADWVTPDSKAYIDRAKSAATHLPELASLRIEMRDRLQSSPLMNAKRLTHSIETAYRNVWITYLSSSKPPR